MNEITFDQKTGKYRLMLSPEMHYWLDPFPEDPLFPFLKDITHADKALLESFNDRLFRNYKADVEMTMKIEKNARIRKVSLILLSVLLVLTFLNVLIFRNFTGDQLQVFWIIACIFAAYLVIAFIRERQIIPSPLWKIRIFAPVELYKEQRKILLERGNILKGLERLANQD